MDIGTQVPGRLHLGPPPPAASQCQAEIYPEEDSYADDGGSGSLVVSTAGGCRWFAASHQQWNQVISGEAGRRGSGTVTFTVHRNRTDEPRRGAILVSGAVVTISQEAGTLLPAPRRPGGRRYPPASTGRVVPH